MLFSTPPLTGPDMAGCCDWICPAAAGLAAGADMLPLLGVLPSIRDRKLPEASSLPALPSEPACSGRGRARVSAVSVHAKGVCVSLQQAAGRQHSCSANVDACCVNLAGLKLVVSEAGCVYIGSFGP